MKKITTLFSLLLIATISFADTHIPGGDVSGIWTIDGSPYIIDGEINIPINSTLIIEPGVQVLFSGHYKFNIYGRILAMGTEEDTIVFTAQDTTTGWHSLRFIDTNTNEQDSSKIVHCKLKYGKATGPWSSDNSKGGAIYCNNSDILIENSLIAKNHASNYGGGIYCYYSSPNIDNSSINGNTSAYGGGICCRELSSPSLKNITISNNESSFGGGLFCTDNSCPNLENVTIIGNYSGYGGGICCQWDSSPSLINATISGNSAYYDGGGICCYYNSSPSLTNIIIDGNSADWSGGGIFSRESSLSLENVSVTGNNATWGGGIFFYESFDLTFNAINPCNIFLNSAGSGDDLCALNCPIIKVIVDTFTVLVPDNNFAYPIDNFTFDILHSKIEQVNQDLYVNPTGSDYNSGLTPEDPFQSVSWALTKIIADSTNLHTIYLTNGTYSPSQTGEIFPLNCRSYVSLQAEDENLTVLDGEGLTCILFCQNDNYFSIENMTIKNGRSKLYGSGIYLDNSNPSLTNVTISENNACYYGGGIYCTDSSPSLSNVTISKNIAFSDYGCGGGFYCCNNSSPSLNYITFSENTAYNLGGGIYCTDNSNLTLLNSILWNDDPQEIYVSSGSVVFALSSLYVKLVFKADKMNYYYINEDQLVALKTILHNSEAWNMLTDIQTKQKFAELEKQERSTDKERRETLINAYNEIMRSEISGKSKAIFIQAFDALNSKERLGFTFHLADFYTYKNTKYNERVC